MGQLLSSVCVYILAFPLQGLHHLGRLNNRKALSILLYTRRGVSSQRGDGQVVKHGQRFISSGWTGQTLTWCMHSMGQLGR